MFGSLMMWASGRFASSPSCVSASGTRWPALRASPKLARILPASEMSAVSIVMPDLPMNFRIIGSSEWAASAGASSTSVRTIFPGSVGMLQRGLLVAVRMALNRDSDRQRRDVAGIREHVDPERRRVAAIALRADAKPVGAREQLLLQSVERGIGVRGADLAEQRLLRQERGLLERAADAHAQDERRARVRTRRLHAIDDEILHALDAGRRGQHRVLRTVFAAAALGHDLEPERGAGNDVHVDDRGRIVPRVHPVEGRSNDGGAQIALGVAQAHALVDRVIESPAGHVHVLAELDETHDEPGVLAIGDPPGPRHLGVVLQDLQHLLAGGGALGGQRPVEGAQHVRLELEIGVDAELLDSVDDRANVDVSHDDLPGIWAIAAWARRRSSPGDTSSLWVAIDH